LNLKCDLRVSKFAFKFNLYRYSTGLNALKRSDLWDPINKSINPTWEAVVQAERFKAGAVSTS
jgi:hypothetical protein